MEIIPAVIGKDFEEVKAKIELVAPLVNWVQIDAMLKKTAELCKLFECTSRNISFGCPS